MTVGVSQEEYPGRVRYDRGFEAAVREGLLSVQEAIERGSRQAYERWMAPKVMKPLSG